PLESGKRTLHTQFSSMTIVGGIRSILDERLQVGGKFSEEPDLPVEVTTPLAARWTGMKSIEIAGLSCCNKKNVFSRHAAPHFILKLTKPRVDNIGIVLSIVRPAPTQKMVRETPLMNFVRRAPIH